QKLLELGADLHATDRSGKTPLMLALDHSADNLDNIDILLKQYPLIGERPEVISDFEQGRLALLFAIYSNDVSAVHALLDTGAAPNARDQHGRTPLMLAVMRGLPEVVTILLKRGADVHARETDGNHWTALHVAADNYEYEKEREYAACARILLEH